MPVLQWFDGSTTATRIRILPFPVGAGSITVEVLSSYESWVDFNYPGLPLLPETGDFSTPYNSFAEGIARLSYGGLMRIKAGQTPETVNNLDKPMVVEAFGGAVTLGIFP